MIMTPLFTKVMILVSVSTAIRALLLVRNNPAHAARQASPGLNLTDVPDTCQDECTTIVQILTDCAENILCQCTDDNALLLEFCVECVIENTVVANQDVVEMAKATLSQFEDQCANAHISLGIFSTPTATAPPMATLEGGPFQSATSSHTSHILNKAAIAGGISGGLVLVALAIWYLLHRNSHKNVTFARKQGPFYRLEEVEGGVPPGLAQKA